MGWDEQRAWEQMQAERRASEIRSEIAANTRELERLNSSQRNKNNYSSGGSFSIGGFLLDIILKKPKILLYLIAFGALINILGWLIGVAIHFLG